MLFTLLIGVLLIDCLAQDLVIENVTVDSTIERYTAFNATVTLKNTGIADISTFNVVRFYISPDTIYDGFDDYSVGSNRFTDLAANDTLVLNTGGSGLGMPPGSYYIIVVADDRNEVDETNEENNIWVSPIGIEEANVDFVFSKLSIDKDTVSRSDQVVPSFEIINQGTTNTSGSIYTSFYISEDNVLDTSDVKLDLFWGSLDGADIVESKSHNNLIMPDLRTGHYFIIGSIDDDYNETSDYDETNETNNIQVAGEVVLKESSIDLEFVDIEYICAEYDWIDISYNVRNNGSTGTNGYEIDIYLSEDDSIDNQDFKLYTLDYDGSDDYIPSHTSINNYFTYDAYSVYGYIPPGSYKVIMYINPENKIHETDTTNNIITYPITIADYSLNMNMDTAFVAEDHNPHDQFISIKSVITNPNANDIHSLDESFTIDITDKRGNEILYEYEYDFLYRSAYETDTVCWDFELDNVLKPGDYYVSITPQSGYINSYNFDFTIAPPMHHVTGHLVKENSPINEGSIYLYSAIDSVLQMQDDFQLSDSNYFKFELYTGHYVLYYIPLMTNDSLLPTIYNRSISLSDSNYILIDTTTSLEFKILSLAPFNFNGTNSISGTVSQDTSGLKSTGEPLSDALIILLYEGNIIEKTHTDSAGYYEFHNLPNGDYEILYHGNILNIPDTNNFIPVEISNNDVTLNIKQLGDELYSTELDIEEPIYLSDAVLRMYPNPCNDKLIIETNASIQTIKLKSLTGTVLHTQQINTPHRITIDLTNYKSGIYLIECIIQNKRMVHKIIVI